MSMGLLPTARRRSRRALLQSEPLESRHLLSTVSSLPDTTLEPIAKPQVDVLAGPLATPAPPTSAYTPQLIRKAYGFDQVQGTGAGQTIAIVTAYDNPRILADLKTFDTAFGIPDPPSFTKVDQNGGSSYPRYDAGWALETALDVEWAHAIAPGARILLVEARSASINDLLVAIDYAARNASVVSMSFGATEFSGETALDSHFNVNGVTFVAASGDDGGLAGAEWPAVSPYVVGVGGSTLSTTSNGSYSTETAWSGTYSGGSGGGVSRYEAMPSYQSALLGSSYSRRRVTPDVAYDANPGGGTLYRGFAVYNSNGSGGWYVLGGTSAGAPQWAGLLALADQARARAGLGALSSRQTLSGLLYGVASTLNASTPSPSFHDITSGSTAAGRAVKGYDPVTGLGTPIASSLIARATSSSITASQLTASPATSSVTVGMGLAGFRVIVAAEDSTGSSRTTLELTAVDVLDALAKPQPIAQAPTSGATLLGGGRSSTARSGIDPRRPVQGRLETRPEPSVLVRESDALETEAPPWNPDPVEEFIPSRDSWVLPSMRAPMRLPDATDSLPAPLASTWDTPTLAARVPLLAARPFELLEASLAGETGGPLASAFATCGAVAFWLVRDGVAPEESATKRRRRALEPVARAHSA